MKEWLNNLRYEESNQCLYDYNLLNLQELYKINKDLYEKEEYIPVYIDLYSHIDYIHTLKEKGLYEKYSTQIQKARQYTLNEIITEFIQWINQHPEYKKLFNKKNYALQQEELQKIKKEYVKISEEILNG